MNFELSDHHDLIIRANTAKEVAELCEHFRFDITKHTDKLVAGEMTHTVSGAKRPWFHQFAVVPFSFLQPYYDLLKKVTGYSGAPFEISAPRYPDSRHRQNLCHTHIVVDAAIGADGYHAEGFIQAEDWNGQPADVRAERNFNEYLRAALGDTKREPQYLRAGNNYLIENPNYLRRHAPHPAAASTALFEAIFSHWLTNHATDAQRDLWAEGEACFGTVVKSETLAASMLRNYDGRFHIENYNRSVTLDEFKALGQKEPQA
jgi:hypothetical protein